MARLLSCLLVFLILTGPVVAATVPATAQIEVRNAFAVKLFGWSGDIEHVAVTASSSVAVRTIVSTGPRFRLGERDLSDLLPSGFLSPAADPLLASFEHVMSLTVIGQKSRHRARASNAASLQLRNEGDSPVTLIFDLIYSTLVQARMTDPKSTTDANGGFGPISYDFRERGAHSPFVAYSRQRNVTLRIEPGRTAWLGVSGQAELLAAIPLPATAALLLAGLVTLAVVRRRRST